ncbi:MAG: hypothetical protein A3I24_03900 [Candidatus Harrisonbacteria bacterium RIFCSPLOWO2_02_FULL_41_13b]|uniref:Uncharacterized protein n=1 Tax=Candidatus Harrisonbacteria bacterium RIFCSPLOWO2_02_FULL_41_13b TaxID=1798409 RepID=A0A1G1ZRQ0_9BACT|nr:MAG: hypothetical protein A3J53_00110 [Candidatus Harrisonbacteria bacterium RIFCSPHIGHO2_02_FULL_40_20]OGY66806.1 MAG: hypothetical protein A3I24_03900 [Candidatus Harrisonbacteria bacterium RIFCSPLOWO2_02_FULL_41_13b]
MLSILIKLFVVAVGVIIVINFLPVGIKEKALALLSFIVPDTIENKIEKAIDPIIHTPAERRETLISKLENNIAELKKSVSEKNLDQLPSTKEIIQQIENIEKIVEKIKDANEEQSPINKVTTAIIKKTAEILAPEEKNPEEPPYSIQESKTPPPSTSCKWVCQ